MALYEPVDVRPENFPNLLLSKFQPIRINPKNKFLVAFPHYSCDPDKDPMTPAGRAWYEATKAGMNQNDWNREMEIDPHAHVGHSVFSDFNPGVHIQEIEPIESQRLIRGWDPGWRCSAAVFLQTGYFDDGQAFVRIYEECQRHNGNFKELVTDILEISKQRYAAFGDNIYDDIDIAAKRHDQASDSTALDVLGTKGIAASYQKVGPKERIRLISHLLISEGPDHKPCFQVHPRCKTIIAGMRGLYRWKVPSQARAEFTRIDETEVVHVMDAMGYPIYNNVHLKFKREVGEREPEHKRTSFYDRMNKPKHDKTYLNV